MPGADYSFLPCKRCGRAKLRRAFSVRIPVDEAIDAEERRREFFRGTPCFGNQPEMPGFEMKGRELVPDAVVRLFVIRLAGILRHAFKRAAESPRGVGEKLDEVILVERIRTWDRRPDVLLENAVRGFRIIGEKAKAVADAPRPAGFMLERSERQAGLKHDEADVALAFFLQLITEPPVRRAEGDQC